MYMLRFGLLIGRVSCEFLQHLDSWSGVWAVRAKTWIGDKVSELCVLTFGPVTRRISCAYLHLDWWQGVRAYIWTGGKKSDVCVLTFWLVVRRVRCVVTFGIVIRWLSCLYLDCDKESELCVLICGLWQGEWAVRAYIWTVTRRVSCACLYLDRWWERELVVLTCIFGVVIGEWDVCTYIWTGDVKWPGVGRAVGSR